MNPIGAPIWDIRPFNTIGGRRVLHRFIVGNHHHLLVALPKNPGVRKTAHREAIHIKLVPNITINCLLRISRIEEPFNLWQCVKSKSILRLIKHRKRIHKCLEMLLQLCIRKCYHHISLDNHIFSLQIRTVILCWNR